MNIYKNIDWEIVCRTSVMSEEKLRVLAEQALLTTDLPGGVAELGSYRGGSVILLAQLLPHKTIHAFESFEGLNNLSEFDKIRTESGQRGHTKGDFAILNTIDRNRIRRRLAKYGVNLHEGTFSEKSKAAQKEVFCFAHFDGDTYRSASEFLDFFYPRLVSGGRFVMDDFGSIATPGVETAALDFFGSKKNLNLLSTNQVVFIKT